jgi:hypothetical protein|tara:strand:- start:8494 stop:9135 length:642 start_codon:yes stop_codon:yes gene_type:complete
MQDTSSFVTAGFRALRDEMADLDFRAGLSRKEVKLSRRLYTHVRARLKWVETLARRLLVLMAAAAGLPKHTRMPVIPEGAQPLSGTAPDPAGAAHPRSGARGFALMPSMGAFRPLDPSVFAPDGGERAGRARRPLAIAPLVHRWRTLCDLLEHPEAAVRRMARLLARLRADGAPRPLCLVEVPARRLPAELGLLAISLPGAIAKALSAWYDTG